MFPINFDHGTFHECAFFSVIKMCISVDLTIMNEEKTVDICCKQQKYGLYMGCMVTLVSINVGFNHQEVGL
jgi:hypothetical protein